MADKCPKMHALAVIDGRQYEFMSRCIFVLCVFAMVKGTTVVSTAGNAAISYGW